jgi:gas vesicle protein
MHLVNQGGDAFRAAADAGQRFGLNAGDGIVAAARAALNFNENLKAMKDGVLNQLVVFIAPVVERIAEAFKTGGISFDGLAQKIFEYSKVIVEWAALVADAWNKPGKSWELLELGMEALSLAIKKGVQEGLAEFQKLFDVGEKVRGMGTVGKALSASLFGPAGVALNNMFGGDDPAAKAKEHAEALEKLKEKFQGIGKAMADMPGGTPIRDRLMKEFDEIEKRMKQFRDRAGDAGDAMGNRIREQIQKQFDAMNQANRTPMEMFREQMLSIQQQAAQGLFAGQKGLMERFQGKAFMELASATQLPEYRMAGAALSTSREAYSAIATQASGMQRQNVQDQMKAIMEEQKRLQEEQVRVGKEAAEAIKALNAKLEVK